MTPAADAIAALAQVWAILDTVELDAGAVDDDLRSAYGDDNRVTPIDRERWLADVARTYQEGSECISPS